MEEFQKDLLSEHWWILLNSVNDHGGSRVGIRFNGVDIQMIESDLKKLGEKYGIIPVVLVGG